MKKQIKLEIKTEIKIKQIVVSSNAELRYILLEDGRLFRSEYQPKVGIVWKEEKISINA